MTLNGVSRRSRPSALVVEDDDLTAHLLQLLLRNEGYAVSRASTGQAAQAYIARSGPLDLITLDGKLPDVSGADVLDFIRAASGWEDVPVLMVTGSSIDEQDLARALGWNDVTYLSKPFTPQELSEVIQRLAARIDALPFRRNRTASRAATQGEQTWQ
jgi:two-component system, OmpR family, phosphate regulon response regulator PhoB